MNTWPLFGFLVLLLVITLFAPQNGWRFSGARELAFFASGIIFILWLILSFKPGMSYVVGDGKIFLRSFWIAWDKLPIENIADVRKINLDELKEFTKTQWVKDILIAPKIRRRAAFAINPKMSIKEVAKKIKAARRYGKLLGYCSVVVSAWATREKNGQSKVKLTSKGEFILITLTNGTQYLISPKDVYGFLEAVNREIPAEI